MYDICHPSYYNIGKLGCNNPVKISTTFYVYMELCEGKKFWHVNYKYNQELDLLYLEAKRTRNSSLEIYVPWPVSQSISIDFIEKIQRVLETKGLIFVFRCGDSTSTCYKVSAGLVKPIAPEITKKFKEKEEEKIVLERNIRKNTSNLYELAKSINIENKNVQCTDSPEGDSDIANVASTSATKT